MPERACLLPHPQVHMLLECYCIQRHMTKAEAVAALEKFGVNRTVTGLGEVGG